MAEDEEIARLEAELAGLSGRAKAMPLLRLGHVCWAAWWRAGPGSAGCLPYLDKAIEALREAHGYFDPNDPERARTAVYLGSLLGARYATHEQSTEDGAAALRLIEDSLDSANIPSVQRVMAT